MLLVPTEQTEALVLLVLRDQLALQVQGLQVQWGLQEQLVLRDQQALQVVDLQGLLA